MYAKSSKPKSLTFHLHQMNHHATNGNTQTHDRVKRTLYIYIYIALQPNMPLIHCLTHDKMGIFVYICNANDGNHLFKMPNTNLVRKTVFCERKMGKDLQLGGSQF